MRRCISLKARAAWRTSCGPSSRRGGALTSTPRRPAAWAKVASGDDLTVGDLVEGPGGLTDARLAKIRDVALNEPALAERLIAADGRTTGVLVTLQFPGEDHTEHLPRAVTRGEEMVADLRVAHPGMTVGMTGLAV